MATSTPDNVIMTADGPRLIDWIGAVRRARRLRPCDLPYPSDRARPESRRRSGTTARRQCGRAVRVRATGWHVPSGAEGGDRALPADRPPPRPLRAGGERRPAGAADPAHRSGPALGGLSAHVPEWPVEACFLRETACQIGCLPG